ncbi:hypothetical protein [uncultured Dysosmobacter sp.]|uniref:hypothetical protein n=1 Tax=uncultured Dysosmobacter sp. TaxID=2591384 RepID=UPI002637CE05|nr:hypothetical protein [uncultured Dysosmobacter sp.]
MKKKHIRVLLAAGVILLTGVVACVHLATRTSTEEGQIQIMYEEKTVSVSLTELELHPVQGSISNAKGETFEIDAMGFPLEELLASAGVTSYETVSVIADDEYYAELTFAELHGEREVYLLEEEEGARLIVFGDANSKRNVSHVARIEIS